jgi:hypothetical protein
MLNPIEFPEFHYDIKLQQQLNELQGKYSKLQTTRNILWTFVIAGGIFIIVFYTYKRYKMPVPSISEPIKDEKETAH